MVMGGFSGWWAFYFLLYVAFIPILNMLFAPTLLALIHSGKLTQMVWRKYLVVNGFISVFASWFPMLIPSDVETKIEYNVSLYRHIPSYVMSVGIMFQGIFFIMWMVFLFRKKELTNGFFKAWGWCFSLLYFVPNVIFLSWVAIGFLKPH